MSGYVRIHRALIGHPAFRNDAEAMAFAWMVAKAAWKPTKARYKGHDVMLKRGQLTISIRDFADAMDRPKGWVERLFVRLREHGMIEQKNGTEVGTKVGTHGGTGHGTPANVITICNYADYQADCEGRETPNKTHRETATGQRQDTEQVREEVKKEAKASKGPKFILPDDIPAEPWAGYEEMRDKIGHKLTDRARQLAVNELRKLAESGWPPGDVLNHCTLNSYRGIYPPKDRNNGRQQQSDPRTSNPTLDILRAANDAIARSEAGQSHSGTGLALPPPLAG